MSGSGNAGGMNGGVGGVSDKAVLVDGDGATRYAVRNAKRYKIGEVAQILGITPESIRYYERMGIIYPERNPVSGYRYYSAWDINMLVRARSYRQEGFGMDEVVDLMREFNPTNAVDWLSSKEDEIKEQIAHQARVMYQIRDDERIVADSLARYDVFRFEYRPAMHFLQTQVGYNIIPSRIKIIGDWVKKHAAFISPGGVYRGPGVDDVAYGFFVEDAKLEEVDFRNEDEVEVLPSCMCLTTSFLSGSDKELKYASFQPALDYVGEKGLEIVGEPTSRIVYMARSDATTYSSLHRLWIPVKGDAISLERSGDKIEEILREISPMYGGLR